MKDLFQHNIFLVGFMGAGKTTVSKCLGSMLGLERVEIDELIARKEGMSINSIFEEYGEEYFRNCESSTLAELQKRNQLVVSCGGGIVLREGNIASMKKNGRVVLLTATPETTLERVRDSDERPILRNNMNVEFIAGLMEKRREKYLKAADIIVETDGKTVHEVCEEIIGKLSSLD
ncbi:MAG: Shikimate kinase [Firmicutes bacterium]|nr:Shikimate kinase [Bacillota bacterium]